MQDILRIKLKLKLIYIEKGFIVRKFEVVISTRLW